MPQVSIHCVQLMHIAFDAAERARGDAQRPNALTLDSITAIVMAAAAAEALVGVDIAWITLQAEREHHRKVEALQELRFGSWKPRRQLTPR